MIAQFRKQYFFLSNYYSCKVNYCGIVYNSSECAFHAQKCPDRAEEFTKLSPGEGKALGRKVPLRKNWNAIRDKIMYEILYCKFTQNKDLKERLLATGDEELVEGNTWYDVYWGVDLHTGKGLNRLGILLMKVRQELRETQA